MENFLKHNFDLVNADTDSITICFGQTPLSEKEQFNLLKELNSLFPEKINFEFDGYFKKVIVFKAKNYILWDGTKTKSKGSALKSGNKEIALREFIQETVQSILHERNDFTDIYHKYVKEALNIQDIKRWSSRKTLSHKTFDSERANESKIVDAIQGTEYKNGDRVWLFFKEDGTLELIERFDGNYDKVKLVKKLFETSKLFKSVLDHGLLYKNYSLKKNQDELEQFK